MINKKLSLAISSATATLLSSASAGTFLVSTIVDETTIINTGQSLISAANFGEAAVNINGLAHTAGSVNGAALTANFSYEGDFRNTQSGLAGNLEILLSGIAGRNDQTGIIMSISGLTPGQDYLYQAYREGESGDTLNFTIEGESLNNVADQTTGTVISYTFNAGDSILNIEVTGNNNAWLSGYSLQTVPEPSSTALLGIGGLALILRRRK